MATTWINKIVNSIGAGLSNRYPTRSSTPSRAQTSSARLSSLSRYYQTKGSQGIAAVRQADRVPYQRWGIGPYGTNWRRPTSQELGSPAARSGYGNWANMTQQEYMMRQNFRQRAGWPYLGVTAQEWRLRQNAAPPGYTWTPYAGWVPTPNPRQTSLVPNQGDVYAGGYDGNYGYDGESARLPDWYNSFLNQFAWKI